MIWEPTGMNCDKSYNVRPLCPSFVIPRRHRRPHTLLSSRLVFLYLIFSAVLPVSAQEFNPEQVVFPITDFKPDIERLSPLEVKFATGFCFDPDCRFVGTNYHTAKLMGRHVRIKGVFSAHLYLDSAPSDVGAQDVHIPGEGSLRYARHMTSPSTRCGVL